MQFDYKLAVGYLADLIIQRYLNIKVDGASGSKCLLLWWKNTEG